DADAALKICEGLEKAGHSCFIAHRDIRSGHEYAEEIVDGIDGSGVVLLLLSKAANSSPHVLREIERAVSKKINIVVYKLEAVELSKSMEYFLMTHQWINEKLDKGYDEIISCINKLDAEGEDKIAADTASSAEAVAPVRSKAPVLKYILAAAAAVCLCTLAVVLAFALRPSDIPAMNEETDESTLPIREFDTADTTAGVITETSAALNTADEVNTDNRIGTDAENTAEQTEAPVSDAEAATEAEEPAADYGLGDTVVMGEYLGEPISWRIIEISQDGTEALVLSDSILTMKAFDAAEGGKYNFLDGHYYWNVLPDELDAETERLLRGDNRWELSNIRTWLNSDRENVGYSDCEPAAKAMSELKNGYNTEAGFLKSFTKKELEAILTSSVNTDGVVTQDRIFLLSSEELKLLETADVSVYAIPTDSAQEQDTSAWYLLDLNDFGVKDHFWWLRNANPKYSSEVYLVNNSYTGERILSQSAGLEGFGIRPAMRLDLTALR
ncbi:MAG: toll/interleukin-1 receptor domain-containing protein, partial [[Eubacterium] siraeum]|nr:toll/interleukin-1 receptor domain-containing protein [[Eubacterium] siraeum]